MKYLKYISIALVILLLAFLAAGLIKPQISYDSQVMVEKPLREAWAVAQDQDKLDEWLSGLKKIVPVSGTPGAVGAVSDVYFDSDGQEMSIRETIADIIPLESISMTYTSEFMNMDYTLRMAAVDGKTEIKSKTVAKGNGVLARSMMAFMGGMLLKQEETNLVNLKRTIEQNTKKYAM